MHQARNERFYVRGCHRQNETEAKCTSGLFHAKKIFGSLNIFIDNKIWSLNIVFSIIWGQLFANIISPTSKLTIVTVPNLRQVNEQRYSISLSKPIPNNTSDKRLFHLLGFYLRLHTFFFFLNLLQLCLAEMLIWRPSDTCLS